MDQDDENSPFAAMNPTVPAFFGFKLQRRSSIIRPIFEYMRSQGTEFINTHNSLLAIYAILGYLSSCLDHLIKLNDNAVNLL